MAKSIGGNSFIHVIANGVDSDYFKPDDDVTKEHAIIFSGMMDQPSHVQAILHFYKHIWPKITDVKGNENLIWNIVGKEPPAKILDLRKKDKRINVTGFVPEVREFLLLSKVFISPLNLRSGMRNTILEALSCGLPVVAFSKACTGLESSPIRKVTTDLDFANTVSSLLSNQDMLDSVGSSSCNYAQQHHNWIEQTQKYVKIFEQVSHN